MAKTIAPGSVILAQSDTGTGTIIGVSVTIVGALAGVVALLFRLLISSKDREFAALNAQKDKAILEMESAKKALAEIAAEALKSATDTANYYRKLQGQAPIIPLAAVVPEGHSPATAKQRDEAAIATMRATMAQIQLATGGIVRPDPGHGFESGVQTAVDATAAMTAQNAATAAKMLKDLASATASAPERLIKATERVADATEKVADK